MLRSPCRHSSTISALNSGVKDRRGRGFFRSMVSILDILSGAVPLMVDVRQSGGSPLLVLGDVCGRPLSPGVRQLGETAVGLLRPGGDRGNLPEMHAFNDGWPASMSGDKVRVELLAARRDLLGAL